MDGILFMAFSRGQEKIAEEVPIIIQFGFVRWKLILSLYSHFLCSREIPCPEKGDHNRILGFSHPYLKTSNEASDFLSKCFHRYNMGTHGKLRSRLAQK